MPTPIYAPCSGGAFKGRKHYGIYLRRAVDLTDLLPLWGSTKAQAYFDAAEEKVVEEGGGGEKATAVLS